MIEETLPTFETFCEYHDVATLAADQEHVEYYEAIVQTYASFAAQNPSLSVKGSMSASVAIRWRGAALQALRSVSSSEAVGADGGRQLNIIMPVILQNLHPENEDYLAMLQQRAQAEEAEDKEISRRRMSIATVRTMDKSHESDSGTVPVTADDADRLAEEEVALQALKSLKQVFITSNRSQIRMATASMLRFICKRHFQQGHLGETFPLRSAKNWATRLMELAARWTPVQDRFVILVTAMETLIRSPVIEDNLEQQLVLATSVGWLLRSDINMIGLSVMDVLLGLIQHILLLLQLGGKGSNVLPHHQQTDAIDLFQDNKDLVSRLSSKNSLENFVPEAVLPSTNRQELLAKLQRCIGDLATHVYYSDEISDIIAAILLRLKPSPISSVGTVAAAIENPEAAARAISTSVHLQENSDTDDFFSFGTARVTALKAIKEVLIVANTKGSAGNAGAIGRNRVSVQVWEGTQWLLRDEDWRVRRAYVDALSTWLRLEMSRNDLRVMEDKRKPFKVSSKPNGEINRWGHTTRRAVSNASQRERPSKPAKSKFLQLLHLAIYNNAIQSPESESDLLLLHLLLVNLLDKLGVNAAKAGIPMVVRLQEDINIDQLLPTPTAKLNIGSLVHGYFWALSEKFNFDSSRVGFEIHNEITRRRNHGLWVEAIRLPPVPLDQIRSASTIPLTEKLPSPILRKESLRPFDSRPAMVELIATAYALSLASPPTSPSASPGRVFSMPILSNVTPSSTPENELPSTIKTAMLAEWSKDICIATTERESSRTVSLNGSRTGTNLSARHKYLGINGHSTRNGSPTGTHSPNRTSPLNHRTNEASRTNNLTFSLQDPTQIRHSSTRGSGTPTPVSSSDKGQILHVDDLKRVLVRSLNTNTRGASPLRNTTSRYDFVTADQRSISSGSESVVSFESASEGHTSSRSLPPAITTLNIPAKRRASVHAINDPAITLRPRSFSSRPHSFRNDLSDQQIRPITRSTMRPSSSSSSATEDPTANAMALRGDLVVSFPITMGNSVEDDVPPVPPLPASVALQRNVAVRVAREAESTRLSEDANFTRDGRGSEVAESRVKRTRGIDVMALLGSIDAVAGGGVGGLGGGGEPPY